jgi:predicted O-linked N-acetylglucosamine transferase (SPINDLY family)
MDAANASFKKGDILESIHLYETALKNIRVSDYILDTITNDAPTKDQVLKAWFNLGTLYKVYLETFIKQMSPPELNAYVTAVFKKSLDCFINILKVVVHDTEAIEQIISLYTQICFIVQEDYTACLGYLKQVLVVAPTSGIIHYNLGHVYQRRNEAAMAIVHYKMAISMSKETHIIVNSFNGISCLYRSLKSWNEARWYLERAKELLPNDPDINNNLAVVYTELRRSDLAIECYDIALKNTQNTVISTNPKALESEVYLNMGHMHSYNGDNKASIAAYNKSLEILPKFRLPFQNKLMNLAYIFNELSDKSYITRQHKYINKILEKGKGYDFSKRTKGGKINIGIVSGDFVEHPVSYFISAFLTHYDSEKFTITCYSECLMDKIPGVEFKLIKNVSATDAADMIYADKMDILFDLAGHTAYNRLDIFALKPAPIQISYCGYPFTTGLKEMDYRITDTMCDHPEISQPYYSEKLLFMPKSFLCYTPKHIPEHGVEPFKQNGFLTIGCFNRLNKINDEMVDMIKTVMTRIPTCRMVFKTKAFTNKVIQNTFLKRFGSLVDRITIMDCTVLHDEHLLTYNDVDVSLDTFPYSGTTTSCESLLMGVPVFTKSDTKYYFHPQNVTKSLLLNSSPSFERYVYNNVDDLVEKLESANDVSKSETRNTFLNGYVCNAKAFVADFESMLCAL